MKRFIYIIASTFILELLLSYCANPGSPSGGPKDTIPPILINSNPVNGSVNFQGSELELEFSELINADKLKDNLIITPKTDVKFKHIIKKNIIKINFEETFSDSTTYSLNFFDGITDITEKSPAVNLVLAFSTGSFIDSMKVFGRVYDLLNEKPSKKFTLGLYALSDTLDFLVESPVYFTSTSDSGTFQISYIKAGDYKVVTFQDENRNLILDPDTEPHGFLADTLRLTQELDSLLIPTLLQDVKPIKFISNRPIGNYQELRYNKRIENYSVVPNNLPSNVIGEKNDILRFYKPIDYVLDDSIKLIISVSDSLLNQTVDTLKIAFLESNRKPQEYTAELISTETSLQDSNVYRILFNKPSTLHSPDSMFLKADSTFTYQITSFETNWNDNRTELNLTTYLKKDSLDNLYEQILIKDSIDLVSSFQNDTLLLDSLNRSGYRVKKSMYSFELSKGVFHSVESDTSARLSITHQQTNQSGTGTLTFKIATEKPSYIIQLLDKSGNIRYLLKNESSPTFQVVPGTYQIRILIDSNNDGKWSYGNLLSQEEPEEIYFFSEEISIRENWIVGEDILISF